MTARVDASPADPQVAAAAAIAARLGPDDVRRAAERIAGRVRRTPTLRDPGIDALAGARVWIKAENLQRIGAFKARGAMHAVGCLPPEQRARGIITYSSGNHAQAVALAALAFGVPATIAMPEDAPAVKVQGVRELGATIVVAGTTSDERKRAAEAIAAQTGGTIVEPFDAEPVICGQGTATMELLDDVAADPEGGTLDALIVPVGGGGLIAGACLAAAAHPGLAVHAVEPVGCDALHQSLLAGHRVAVPPGPTIADGLKPVRVGALNFAIAQTKVAGTHHVTDAELGRAVVVALMRAKLLLEPSGAAALAVALRGGLPGAPARIGVIASGGNVDPQLVAELLRTAGASA